MMLLLEEYSVFEVLYFLHPPFDFKFQKSFEKSVIDEKEGKNIWIKKLPTRMLLGCI